MLQTVVETLEYIKRSKSCMDEISRESFIIYIAGNPLCGDLIPETGGARKIRWASDAHRGKRGGARVIYYYYSEDVPIFLFTAYAKNECDDLASDEKRVLKKLIKAIVQIYGGNLNE